MQTEEHIGVISSIVFLLSTLSQHGDQIIFDKDGFVIKTFSSDMFEIASYLLSENHQLHVLYSMRVKG